MLRSVGSDGKAGESGLKGSGFHLLPALVPMRSILLQIHVIINSHGNGKEGTIFP